MFNASKEGGFLSSLGFSPTGDCAQRHYFWSEGVRLCHTNRVVVAPIVDHPNAHVHRAKGCFQIVQQRSDALGFVPHGHHHLKGRCLRLALSVRVHWDQVGFVPPSAPTQQGEHVAEKGCDHEPEEDV